MAVENLIALPITFADRDPMVAGSGTPFDAAHFNPNFDEIESKFNNHRHSEFDTFALVGDFNTHVADFDAHVADTTAVHGITDTSLLVYTNDARLSDMRIPADGSVTDAKVAGNAAISYAKLNLGASVKLTDLNFIPTTLTSPGTFTARTQDAAGMLVLASRVGTDAFDRFTIATDGKHSWGAGAGAVDTTLYRGAASQLNTDGAFVAGTYIQAHGAFYALGSGGRFDATNQAASSIIFNTRISGDAANRFTIINDGKHQWSDGTNAVDTNLYRAGASSLKTDGSFTSAGSIFATSGLSVTNGGVFITRTGNPSNALTAGVVGDTQSRLIIDTNGKLNWGPGNAATDTNLYRSSAGNLHTDGAFGTGTSLTVGSTLTTNGTIANNDTTTVFAFRSYKSAAGPVIVNYLTNADSVAAFVAYGDGQMQWGAGGTSARDTWLYRNSPGVLKTDGSFYVAGNVLNLVGGTTAITARSAVGSNTMIFATRAASDTQDRFQFDSSGKMQWGSGNAAADINFYRAGVGVLATDNIIQAQGAAGSFIGSKNTSTLEYARLYNGSSAQYLTISNSGATDWAVVANLLGDSANRFQVNSDGKIGWGDGTTVTDTNLYRIGASSLKTDGHLTIGGNVLARGTNSQFVADSQNSSTNTVFAARVSGDAYSRVAIRTDGLIRFGTGAVDLDTNLYRSGTSQLKTDNEFIAAGPITTLNSAGGFYARTILNSSTNAFSVRLGTDTVDRLNIMGDGKIQWGSGTNPTDTNLYRNAANVLRTDGAFWASGGFAITGNATGLYTAAATTTSTKLLSSQISGDAQARFVAGVAGSLTWGDGTNPADTTLARVAAGRLALGTPTQAGRLNVYGGVAGDFVLAAYVGGDSNGRLFIGADGKHQWGDGTNAVDTNLYRQSAGVLKTDGGFQVGTTFYGFGAGYLRYNTRGQVLIGADVNGVIELGNPNDTTGQSPFIDFHYTNATVTGQDYNVRIVNNGDGVLQINNAYTQAVFTLGKTGLLNLVGQVTVGGLASSTTGAFATNVTGDTNNRFQTNADGTLSWGSGNTSADVNMYRNGAGWLKIGSSTMSGRLGIIVAGTANTAYGVAVTSDAAERFVIAGDGKFKWGDGTGATDTFLYRAAAGMLKTDGQLVVAQTATFSASLSVGQLVTYNKTADPGVAGANQARTYLRDNGAGKMQLVVQMPTGAPIVLATEA